MRASVFPNRRHTSGHCASLDRLRHARADGDNGAIANNKRISSSPIYDRRARSNIHVLPDIYVPRYMYTWRKRGMEAQQTAGAESANALAFVRAEGLRSIEY